MKTTFRTRQPYADQLIECAKAMPCSSPAKPLRFIEKMQLNKGSVSAITGTGLDEEGLERRNPVIVALGDSVTAGHFESLLPTDPAKLKEMFEGMMQWEKEGAKPVKGPVPPVEITDPRESYIEKFRAKLIDKYEQTSVSVINAGIAGDILTSMAKRARRDVVQCQPDLVLINGSLNWNDSLGTTAEYKEILKDLVAMLKAKTQADIVLLTPNGELPNTMFPGMPVAESRLGERVQAIREVAREEMVCLADVYALWEKVREEGCPWEELLANRINHPSVEGHEAYAIVLMKLFE